IAHKQPQPRHAKTNKQQQMKFAYKALVLVLVLAALLGNSAFAGTTQAFTFSAKGYPGSRDRQYKVYVPDGLSAAAPMVMVLHGCEQTHNDVLHDWGMTAAAD